MYLNVVLLTQSQVESQGAGLRNIRGISMRCGRRGRRPRSPGLGPLLEGVKILIICFRGILVASGHRAIKSVTEIFKILTYAWGRRGALPAAWRDK